MAASRISAVNLAEVISHFIHAGMPASEVDADAVRVQVVVVR